MKNKFYLLLLTIGMIFQAISAQPKLDVDIITGSISSNPKYYCEFQSKLYFQGYDGKNGRELWEYDGKSTPSMTANIHTGSNSNSSNPSEFCVFNNKLYFSATNGSDGYELWEYDGKNSPKQIKDLYRGVMSSLPSDLIVYKGKLYFEAQDSAHGYEMWSLDSNNNINLVADIKSGTSGSYAQQFIIYNDTLFFQADNGSNGNELWAFTGSGSPFMFANIASGSNSSLPGYFSVMNNCLYFSATSSSTYGRELYKYSSKTGQITLVKDIWSGTSSSNPNQLYTYDGQLYFQAIVTGYGYELMTCNSKDSVWRVADIRSGSGSGNPMSFHEYDSKLYFRATDGKAGEELWIYDGKKSPYMLMDIDSGAGSSYPVYFTTFRNNLYFTADDGKHGSEIWIIEDCPTSSKSIDTVKKCNSYKWIDGKTYTNSTNSPFIKYTNKQGCDSVISLDLTIYKSDYKYQYIDACKSYKWVNGTTYDKSNYSDTFLYQNQYGCDSVVYLKLSIHQANTGIDTQISCDSLKWINGITYYSSTSTPTDTLVNQWGCDSIVSLHLTINNTQYKIDTVNACNSFTWIDGNTYKQSTNSPEFKYQSYLGCDSIIKLELNILNSSSSIERHTSCDSFIWRDGNLYTQSTNKPYITLTNHDGCDSIVYLNLTVNKTSRFTIKETTCDEFKWINGTTYTKSTVTDYLTSNYLGCDSLITLDLTVNYSSSGTHIISECNSYQWIDGKTYTESTNIPQYLIKNQKGCDSLVNLNLTILQPTQGVDYVSSCSPVKWLDGKTYDTSTSIPNVKIKNYLGCDSIVTLNYTRLNATRGTDIQKACDSYKWIDGKTYTNSTMEPMFSSKNHLGCDSLITLNLTINRSSKGFDTVERCGSYTWIDGKTYYSTTKTPTYLLKNEMGCDSVIQLNLNILPMPNIVVNYNGSELQPKQYNAVYQWLDCDDDYKIIAGATNRTFSPGVNGNYAMDVKLNKCRDTSDCILVSNLSVEGIWEHKNLLYPNPSRGEFQSFLPGILSFDIYNLDGRRILSVMADSGEAGNTRLKLDSLSPSIYLVRINTKTGPYYQKVEISRD